MRTEDQIKSKLNQLLMARQRAEGDQVNIKIQLDIQIEMLEWVLNQPTGSYHS